VPTIRGGLVILIGAHGAAGAVEGRTISGAGDILLLLLVCCCESISPRSVSIFRDPLSEIASTGDEAGIRQETPISDLHAHF